MKPYCVCNNACAGKKKDRWQPGGMVVVWLTFGLTHPSGKEKLKWMTRRESQNWTLWEVLISNTCRIDILLVDEVQWHLKPKIDLGQVYKYKYVHLYKQ